MENDNRKLFSGTFCFDGQEMDPVTETSPLDKSGVVKRNTLIDRDNVVSGQEDARNGDISADQTDKDKKIETVVSLKKQISLLQSVAIIVGIIIGSGIFVSPVGILSNVKSVGMSCIMWGVCGVFSGLCALCYAELGACIPISGGEYVYIKRAFGDFPAFLCLWINFIIICPVGIAASSLIFATYVLQPLFSDCDPPPSALRLLAALIVSKYILHLSVYLDLTLDTF